MSAHDPALQGWRQLGEVDPAALVDARLQLHWAGQLLAAVGYTHIPKADDDGQSNSGWVDGMQVLAGRHVGDPPACFVSLAPASLTVALCDAGGETIDEFACSGHTLDEAYAWLEQALATCLDREVQTLNRPTYDLPDHPVAQGRPFQIENPAAFVELARWIHNSNIVMRDLRAKEAGASLPRLWPHHYDLGMLISLEDDGNAQSGRSIGIGLSLGDAKDPSPYWYVSPYPTPEAGKWPPLSGAAHWTTEGFTGAKLDAADQVKGDAQQQESSAREYVYSAIQACRQLLG